MKSFNDKSVDLISKIDRSKTLADWHNWAIDRDVVDWLQSVKHIPPESNSQY